MKYFAKYLLTKEKYCKHGEPCLYAEGDIGISGKPYKSEIGAKPIKLFLCSRDIQVGDKVNNNNIIKTIEQNKGSNPDEIKLLEDDLTHWFTFEQGGLSTNKDTFKVIGEISPDAIWVKEGDEFDEDKLCVRLTNMHGALNNYAFHKFEDILQYNSTYIRIGIKGPCGHFH